MFQQVLLFRPKIAGGLLRLAAACAGAMIATSAQGAVIVTANTSNTVYGAGFLGTPRIDNGQIATIVNATETAGVPAEYALDFATSSTNDSFSFLQNQYCVGKCTTYAMTTVTLTLANTGNLAEAMRFDSIVTPGHLAYIGNNATASAVFDFDVKQTTGGNTRTLYSADGVANASETTITTSNGIAFNGLTRSSGADYNVLDWSATNIVLLLDSILPGQTSTLTYTSLTRTTTNTSNCTAIANCDGVQVVFGDPRNNGGGISRTSLDAREATAPVIGRQYGPADVPVDIVAALAPLPDNPPVLDTPRYGALFVSQFGPDAPAVPEPASWMVMVLGFGFTGAALRGHRRSIAIQR